MEGFDDSWTEILKFFLTSHIDVCLFLDNVEIIQIKYVSGKKSRGLRTSKIVKSRQSYSNGHLPYHCCHCSFYDLARALMRDVACEFACAESISANVLRRSVNLALVEHIRRMRRAKLNGIAF